MSVRHNRYSSRITTPKFRGVSQAMRYDTGPAPESLAKVEDGIAANGLEGNTCSMHMNGLVAQIKEGVGRGRAGGHALQHPRRW